MNLLSKVTRGPWTLLAPRMNDNVQKCAWDVLGTRPALRGSKKAQAERPFQNIAYIFSPATGTGPRGGQATTFSDLNEGEANAKLVTLSYDHALLLAAVTNDKVDIVRNGVVIAGKLVSVGIATKDGVEDADLDPFGCPILTDELRTELERLLGLNSAEIARKSPAEEHPAKESESQVSQE